MRQSPRKPSRRREEALIGVELEPKKSRAGGNKVNLSKPPSPALAGTCLLRGAGRGQTLAHPLEERICRIKV